MPILAVAFAGHIQPAYTGPVSTHVIWQDGFSKLSRHGISMRAELGCRPQTAGMIDSDAIHVMRQAWPIWHLGHQAARQAILASASSVG